MIIEILINQVGRTASDPLRSGRAAMEVPYKMLVAANHMSISLPALSITPYHCSWLLYSAGSWHDQVRYTLNGIIFHHGEVITVASVNSKCRKILHPKDIRSTSVLVMSTARALSLNHLHQCPLLMPCGLFRY